MSSMPAWQLRQPESSWRVLAGAGRCCCAALARIGQANATASSRPTAARAPGPSDITPDLGQQAGEPLAARVAGLGPHHVADRGAHVDRAHLVADALAAAE